MQVQRAGLSALSAQCWVPSAGLRHSLLGSPYARLSALTILSAQPAGLSAMLAQCWEPSIALDWACWECSQHSLLSSQCSPQRWEPRAGLRHSTLGPPCTWLSALSKQVDKERDGEGPARRQVLYFWLSYDEHRGQSYLKSYLTNPNPNPTQNLG